MKKSLMIVAILSVGSVLSWAALPVIDGFYEFNDSQWDQFWTVDATFAFVDAGTDGIPDSPLGTGKMIKISMTNAAASSFGIVAGEETDANYSMKAQVYIPVVSSNAAPDNFLYHQLIFYRDAGGYGRLHAQFNEDTGAIAAPRIRCQIANPSFVSPNPGEWSSPTDFTHSQGWHELKVELNGTTGNCYYDGNLLGAVDWTATAASRAAGRVGMGGYLNGAGTIDTYFAGFKAWQGAEPDDPTPPEPTPIPLAAQNWTYYE